MDCIVYMVALDTNNDEVYVAINFDTGTERYPENTPEDISKVVGVCNNYDNDGLTFIDMYGIQKEGMDVEKWEEIKDAV